MVMTSKRMENIQRGLKILGKPDANFLASNQNIDHMDKNHISTIKRSILNLDHFTSQPGQGCT